VAGKDKILNFEVSAHLHKLIGRELVSTDEMAVVELVKNAYDAGARRVTITIEPITDRKPGFVKIVDDGEGMDIERFRRIFLFAGYSERPEQVGKVARVPTGEKGIGRFAADRLGRYLDLTTKIRGAEEALTVHFDWEAFSSKKKKFNKVKVKVVPKAVTDFPASTSGTVLYITGLRAIWKREKLMELRTVLSELLDPFKAPTDFEIHLEIPDSVALSGKIQHPGIEEADIELDFKVQKGGNVKRSVRTKWGQPAESPAPSNTKDENLAGLHGRFFYYLKRPTKLQTKGIRPGIQLYRDGFRVEPFGSPKADWLGLAEKRAKRAGHAHIVPTRFFGFVEASRLSHSQLQDTTSRQALIDSDMAQSLVGILREQSEHLENLIRTEVAEPKWKERAAARIVELERARLHSLGIMSYGLAHEIRQPLQSIRSEAGNIATRLGQLGVVDQDINESRTNIDADIERINETIELLAEISTGNVDTIDTFDLAELVRKESQLFARRSNLEQTAVELNAPEKQMARLNRTTVSSVLFNLWKNALDAIRELTNGRQGRVKINLSRKNANHIIEITDNGVGMTPEIQEKILNQFATGKTGGLGLGLYYCNVVVQSNGGEITFESRRGVGTTFTVVLPDRP
jgi:signal transduction histidine kinase